MCVAYAARATGSLEPQYTEIHRVQAQRQVQETLYMMGYREK